MTHIYFIVPIVRAKLNTQIRSGTRVMIKAISAITKIVQMGRQVLLMYGKICTTKNLPWMLMGKEILLGSKPNEQIQASGHFRFEKYFGIEHHGHVISY